MDEKQKGKIYLFATITILILMGVFAFIKESKEIFLLAGLLSVALVFLFYKYQKLGLYAIIFFYPYLYLQIIYKDINAPIADFIAMAVFASWIVRHLVNAFKGKENIKLKDFPGFALFLLFIVSAIVSLYNSTELAFSIKYIARPLAFFYLMFVFLPFNIIDSKKVLKNCFYVLYTVGLIVAFMGFLALFLIEQSGFIRTMPIPIGSIWPMGGNHNLLAETLIAIIPVGFLLSYWAKDIFNKKLLIIGTLFMAVICLMTLSRAAWVCMLIMFIIYFSTKIKIGSPQNVIKIFIASLIVILPLAIYMLSLNASYVAKGSNFNRMFLSEISFKSWLDHPFIGNGAGSFERIVSENPIYIIEFGAPIDSHGFVQKLLLEQGLFGLLSFLALLIYLLNYIFKAYKKAKSQNKIEQTNMLMACLLTAIGSSVFQLFNTSYYSSKMWLPIGIALAATKFLDNGKK